MVFLFLAIVCAEVAFAADPGTLLRVDLQPGGNPANVSVAIQIFLMLTVLSLAPSILIMVTCFTRIAIVLSLLRQAIGSNQLPPNQIIVGLTLFLTVFIMTPVWQTVHREALKPYLDNQLSSDEALRKAEAPIRAFMLKQTREKDLALLVDIAKLPRPKNVSEVPTTVLIPSFIISELKTAFQIGFMLYIPFLIIDMVVASVLLSMGMMMLPPVMVSLPFKLMIFVLTDGWYLIVGSLVKSFGP
ncbi:MAG: flagellar biosynthetic protein FliP [Desulfobacteraceae bacterium]|nr:MAG: flagellar biosynthetic protein FliP [Desulfobacteraceae bacterium]